MTFHRPSWTISAVTFLQKWAVQVLLPYFRNALVMCSREDDWEGLQRNRLNKIHDAVLHHSIRRQFEDAPDVDHVHSTLDLSSQLYVFEDPGKYKRWESQCYHGRHDATSPAPYIVHRQISFFLLILFEKWSPAKQTSFFTRQLSGADDRNTSSRMDSCRISVSLT